MLKYYQTAILVLCVVYLGAANPESHWTSMVFGPAWSCAEEAGCFNGKCWTWCGALARQWCYTTASNSNGGPEAICQTDSECDRCWKCHSPCGWQ